MPDEDASPSPETIATAAIPDRPNIQPKNSGFSLSKGRKYGNTMKSPSVSIDNKESRPKLERELPISIARKNSTKVVSVAKRPETADFALISEKVIVFSIFLAKKASKLPKNSQFPVFN